MRLLVPLLLALSCIAADIAPSTQPGRRSEMRFHALREEYVTVLGRTSGQPPEGTPALNAMRDRVDAQGGMKDAWRCDLYWHTNLDEALAAAKQSGKPILSLRLLGRLDEEMSCANSRFFRKLLYQDERVAKTMRENYILYWESLRPVPIVTIDFGDGRTVKRTCGGNSIHYILLPDGRPFDAMPGLLDPLTFADELGRAREFVKKASAPSDAELSDYWKKTILRLAEPEAGKPLDPNGPITGFGPITITKNSSEFSLPSVSNDVRADTVINQRTLRPKILSLLAAGEGKDLAKMNKRVYAELFRTPLDDPELGMNPSDESVLFKQVP